MTGECSHYKSFKGNSKNYKNYKKGDGYLRYREVTWYQGVTFWKKTLGTDDNDNNNNNNKIIIIIIIMIMIMIITG